MRGQKKLSFGHCIVDNLESLAIMGFMNSAALNQTLVGIQVVRPSALSVQERRALADALCDWRLQLIGRITPNEYQAAVRRHVDIVSDPGTNV